ncbi:probably inactive receptor-like protein kinase At2g46850 [Phalaenopsis equestris]|uniref:probably inactive receptor-like protein kinase At2g46850 n=1 Tax=Phalaenopsis equestris TaxID=78828 RepID=UPI0009E2483C|nr:probably inactive receptor-like protein kinase At2g46850 [Phalaenopsis equestris]
MDHISTSTSLLLFLVVAGSAASKESLFTNPCNELCGDLSLPYPFYLNSSCGPQIDAFRLTCTRNSSLYLTLGPTELRIIAFLTSSSILLDYSSKSRSNSNSNSSPCDRWYADLKVSAAVLNRSPFVAVTTDNVLRLYACDDSSVCRSGCERVGGCEGGCCYPLSDGSVWKAGEGIGVFGEYGCRGFSSWVEKRGLVGRARRGIEVEWAVPMRLVEDVACANGAVMVNATVVKKGYRCSCGPGLVGDGFARGIGCFKACSDEGHSANGDCCKGRFCKKRVAIFVGAIISAIFVSGALAICFLVKVPVNRSKDHPHQACLPKILGKACRTRLFTYQELNDATKGFDHEQQLISVVDGTIHIGVIDDGSLVAVHKVNCENEQNLKQVWEIIEILSQASHKNIARIIGCCISSNHSLLLVHEFFSHGTLEEHLQRRRGNGFSWYHRLNIAIEVASALSFLRSEISPPVNLHDLKSSEIYIDAEYSIKIASFKFLSSTNGDESCSYAVSHDARIVNNFGLILLELITGSRKEHLLELTLLKIRDRKLHEIVDPYLRFGEQPSVQCEQIERVALFAMQCLGSRMGESVSMVTVAKEFILITHDGVEEGGKKEPILEVTFSNSSLLQMISMSPDTLHVP